MALFNPEKIIATLVAGLGLTPGEVRQFVSDIWNEFQTQRAERIAFKAACQKVVPDVVARLERLEQRQREIYDMIHALHTELSGPAVPVIEGECNDDRSINGHV